MAKKLTNISMEKLKPRSTRYEVCDTQVDGLHVRVSEFGTKSFVLVMRYPGSRHPARRSLGKYPDLSLADAREKAKAWRALVAQGKDPKVEAKRAQMAEARKRVNSVASVAEAYISHHVAKLRSGHVSAQDIRRDIMGAWGTRPITDITKSDIIELIDKVALRGRYMAHNVFGHIRGMFSWAMLRDQYGLEVSPCASIRPSKLLGEREARDRVLDDDELRAFWNGCSKLGYPLGDLYQLLLLTGCRRNEIGEARWSEVDLAARVLRVPPERSKTGVLHMVPLSDIAMEIITRLPRFEHPGDAYLFSTTRGATAASSHGRAKTKLDKLMAEEMGREAAPWVLHDLRRTCRARLASLRVPFEIAEMVLGHTLGGVAAVYNRYSYHDEVRDALAKWAAKLDEIVANRSVEQGTQLGALPAHA